MNKKQVLPPVRSLATVKKKKKTKKNSDATKKSETKEQKIKGYDYRNWDKFDVVNYEQPVYVYLK